MQRTNNRRTTSETIAANMEIKLASVVAGSDFDDTQSTELQNTSDQTAHYDGWEEAFFQFVTVRHTSNFTIKQVSCSFSIDTFGI